MHEHDGVHADVMGQGDEAGRLVRIGLEDRHIGGNPEVRATAQASAASTRAVMFLTSRWKSPPRTLAYISDVAASNETLT